MKMLLFFLLMFVSNPGVFSQERYGDKINRFNNNGRKEGLWVDTTSNVRREIYYKNGVKSGIFKQYTMEGRLYIFGELCNGKMCGTWYYLETTGHLVFILKEFKKNSDSITLQGTNKKYIPEHKCYSISYYPNGSIEDEGVLLWSEGDTPEVMSFEHGEWKYYDEKGNLVRTKIYE